MKRLFRWMRSILITLSILVGLLLLTAWIYRDKLVNKLLDEINQQVEADVAFDSYTFSPFRNFPDMSLAIRGLSIAGREPFAGDTLMYMGKLYVEVDLWSLIKPPFRVESIQINTANIRAKVLEDGSANWDIFPEQEPTSETVRDTTTGIRFEIQTIRIRDSRIQYSDLESAVFSTLKKVNADFSSKRGNPFWDSGIMIENWDLEMEGMPLLQDMQAELSGNLRVNPDSFAVFFGPNTLHLNEMPFSLDGFAAMPDTSIVMDIGFRSDASTFKDLLSLVPFIYRTDFHDLEAQGKVLFSGRVKGAYDAVSFPQTKLLLKVSGGEFSWPDLPKQVSEVELNLEVHNQGGTLDGTTVDLSTFHARFGDDPLDMAFFFQNPESDPFLRTHLETQLDLGSWRSFLPLEETGQIAGTLQADIHFSGKVASVKTRRFDLVKAEGTLTGKDIRYQGAWVEHPVFLDQLAIGLDPERINVDQFAGKAGESDLALKGLLSNYLPWLFNAGVLKADFTVSSNLLDVREWLTSPETGNVTEPRDSLPAAYIQIPDKLDAGVVLSVGELRYDKYTLNDLQGTLHMADGVARMEPVSFRMLGGEMQMKGTYASGNPHQAPAVDLDVLMSGMALDQTVQTFNTVRQLAPIAKRCSGQYTAGIKIRGILSEGFSPDLSTLNGRLQFKTDKLKIEQADVIQQIGQLTGSGYFESPTLSKVNALVEFHQGMVTLKPFTTRVKEAELVIGGIQGLDGSLDYRISVDLPSSALQFEKSNVAQQLFDLPLAKAVDIKWPERVKFDALIGGTLKEPSVSLAVKEQLKSIKDVVVESVKDKATEELEKRRAEWVFKAEAQAKILLDEANKQGDKLIAEAQAQAEKINALADQQIDQLKKEADKQAADLVAKAGANPLKKRAAQEAAGVIRSEAQKKADKLKQEAASQANKGVAEARKQKESLVSKAKEEGEKLIEEARIREM
jgi:hypothetical protein